MIVEYGRDTSWVGEVVDALAEDELVSSVQVTIGRSQNGLYRAQLSRTTVNPARVQGMCLGYVCDVPPGQRRATWLLTDAVNLALTDPEAHMLLHW